MLSTIVAFLVLGDPRGPDRMVLGAVAAGARRSRLRRRGSQPVRAARPRGTASRPARSASASTGTAASSYIAIALIAAARRALLAAAHDEHRRLDGHRGPRRTAARASCCGARPPRSPSSTGSARPPDARRRLAATTRGGGRDIRHRRPSTPSRCRARRHGGARRPATRPTRPGILPTPHVLSAEAAASG